MYLVQIQTPKLTREFTCDMIGVAVAEYGSVESPKVLIIKEVDHIVSESTPYENETEQE